MAQSKTRWAQLRVGIMALTALIILSVLIFLMAGSSGLFKSKTRLYTYMADSSALAASSPVRLNGILIGKVSSVDLSGQADPSRVVRITLEIDNDFLTSIPVDSQALIAAENLLGTKFINIKKGMAKDTVKADTEIKSGETAAMEDLFQQGANTITALNITLKRVDGIVASIESGNGTIGKLLSDDTLYKKVLSVVDDGTKLVATLNDTLADKNSSLGKLLHDDAIYEDARASVAKINTMLDGLNKGEGSAGKFLRDPALFDELQKTIADTRKLINQVNDPKGDIGKLLTTDELHAELKQSMGKLDSIMDKINSGQGTIGQLLVNPQLYESLDGATREVQGLMKDFRANPKKFLRIKLGIF
jgi:phospholipid/cholesterol/gamma-HCH transport system substrate-binding protein